MKKILIAEDDETVTELLKFILKEEGFEVDDTFDGNKVIPLIKEKKSDLLILDVALPGKSGIEIVKTLSHENIEIPTIITTGKFTQEELRREMLIEKNVKDVIIKPIRPAYLIYKIHQILGTIPKEERMIKEKKLEIEFET